MPEPTLSLPCLRTAKSRSRLYLSIQYEQAKYSAATRYLRPTLLRCSARCGKGIRFAYCGGYEYIAKPGRAGPGPGWGRLYNRLGWVGPGRAGEGWVGPGPAKAR